MKYAQIATILLSISVVNTSVESGNPTCQCGWRNRARIIGGKEAEKNEFPWMVAIGNIRGHSFSQFCGGSIITPWHVLTAAHCTQGRESRDTFIVIGAHDISDVVQDGTSELIAIVQIVEHEDYDKISLINDISLLVTAREILFNNDVGPVCLSNERINLVDQYIKVTGWGLTSFPGKPSPVLQHVSLRVIPHHQCKRDWPDISDAIPPTQICTFSKNKDSCFQDSGGPLVWLDSGTNRFIQVALVSFGSKCGGPRPAVNTAVISFIEWIQAKIEETNPKAHICTVEPTFSLGMPHMDHWIGDDFGFFGHFWDHFHPNRIF